MLREYKLSEEELAEMHSKLNPKVQNPDLDE